eukprot:6462928-Amphidinium_carterae.1
MEQLQQSIAELQRQMQEQATELARITQENQLLHQQQQQQQQPGQQLQVVVQQLGQAVQALAQTRGGASAVPRLVDTKGLGKPMPFKNDTSKFNEWLRKTSSYFTAAYGSSFKGLLDWVEDQEQTITTQDLAMQFNDVNSPEYIECLEEKDAQLHAALMALTEGEAFDIVLGCASCGSEALRKLIRRFDPSSGGRRRVVLKQILNPQRVKLDGLPLALEKWDDLIRRYEKRRAGGDPAQILDGDIKIAALEALVSVELEHHLAMNRTRLTTYEKVRAEVNGFIDAKISQGAI